MGFHSPGSFSGSSWYFPFVVGGYCRNFMSAHSSLQVGWIKRLPASDYERSVGPVQWIVWIAWPGRHVADLAGVVIAILVPPSDDGWTTQRSLAVVKIVGHIVVDLVLASEDAGVAIVRVDWIYVFRHRSCFGRHGISSCG